VLIPATFPRSRKPASSASVIERYDSQECAWQ
jgi:hypothetical protein